MSSTVEPTRPCQFANQGIAYSHRFLENIENSAPKLAGVFGLETADEIWRLWFDEPATRDVFDAYIAHREGKYGMDLAKKLDVVKPRIMEIAFNPDYLGIISAKEPPKVDDSVVFRETIATFTCVWYIARLMEVKPSFFPKSSTAPTLSFDRYDLLHAWKLMLFFWKYKTQGKISKSRKPHRTPASKPEMHGEADVSVSTSVENHAKDPPLRPSDEVFGLSTEDLAELDEPDPATGMNTQPIANDMEIADMVTKSMDTTQSRGLTRPPMDADQRRILHQHMLKMDGFQRYCLIHQPENTDVPDKDDGAPVTLLTSLASSAGGLASARGLPDNEMDEAITATKEDAAATISDMLKKKREGALELSAPPPCYQTSCTSLSVRPDHPSVGPCSTRPVEEVVLMPWQVSGVAWMIEQEQSPVRGGILADQCGLGKTLQALMLVYVASLQEAVNPPNQPRKPTLILCPSGLIDTWLTEITRRFGDAFKVLLFHGNSIHTGDFKRKNLIVDNVDALRTKLKALGPKDPATSRTLVLSSYTTWASRTTFIEKDLQTLKEDASAKAHSRKNSSASTTDATPDDRAIEVHDPDRAFDPAELKAILDLADLQDKDFDRGQNSDRGRKAWSSKTVLAIDKGTRCDKFERSIIKVLQS
ncbi:SNF2 family N-terminal domain-containing protein [Aspergillus varians]